jgi:hypothetical protein
MVPVLLVGGFHAPTDARGLYDLHGPFLVRPAHSKGQAARALDDQTGA